MLRNADLPWILSVDVDDVAAVPTTTMWLILLLILADEDPYLILFRRWVDTAADPCGQRSFPGPLPSMWLILLVILEDEDLSFDPLPSM